MSNYRRLISYIYAYEGGIKGRNIGYAKIEVRSGQCRIYVSVKKIYIGSNDIGVYLLTPGAELMVGRIFIRGGNGEFRVNIPAENIDGKGCSIDRCYGLTIHDVENTWQCYTTIWEDAVAHVAEVELADVTAENVRKKEAEQEKNDVEAEDLPDSIPVLPISAEIEADLKREEEGLKDVKPWQAEMEALDGKTMEEEEEKGRAEEEKLEINFEEKEKVSGEAELEETGSVEEQSEKVSLEDAAVDVPKDPFRELPVEISKNIPGKKLAEAPMETVEEAQKVMSVGEAASPERNMEILSEQDAAAASGTSAAPYAKAQISAGAQIPVKPQAFSETPQKNILKVLQEALVKMPRAAAKPSETDNRAEKQTDSSAKTENSEVLRDVSPELSPEMHTLSAAVPEKTEKPEVLSAAVSSPTALKSAAPEPETLSTTAPSPEDPFRLEELDRLERQESMRNDIWSRMERRYAKVLAFEYDNGCEILSIKPQDIGLLPREIWVYGNNSFLLHGYYNYRHLILAKLNNPKGAPRYLLGVPGHYFSNEKYMASMFGFPHFVLAKKQPQGDGRFGYWYTDIRL